jgi:hypothetical protein
MNYTLCDNDKVYPYLIIDDFYNEEEEKKIWIEVELLFSLLKNEKAETGNMAVDDNGNKKGDARRIYLDTFYNREREQSSILTHYNKIVSDEVIDLYSSIVPSWVTFDCSNRDTSQISYYENGGHYGEHFDMYMHTCLIWFFREPKRFDGGDLFFTKNNQRVECKHNRMLLFPSYYFHEVKKLSIEEKFINQGLGRYCLTHFYSKV